MRGMMRKKKPTKKDRRQPHRMMRVPLDVYEKLKALAEQNDRSTTRELRHLIVEKLKQAGLWSETAAREKGGSTNDVS